MMAVPGRHCYGNALQDPSGQRSPPDDSRSQWKQGCTLDRSHRSDICNTYFCGVSVLTSASVPTKVIAGEGNKMRTSPVLAP